MKHREPFVVTHHAVERYIERVEVVSPERAREIIAEASTRCTRTGSTHRDNPVWSVPGSDMQLVSKWDPRQRVTICVTVLGPGAARDAVSLHEEFQREAALTKQIAREVEAAKRKEAHEKRMKEQQEAARQRREERARRHWRRGLHHVPLLLDVTSGEEGNEG